MKAPPPPKETQISVIIPVFKTSDFLCDLHQRLQAVLVPLVQSHEIIFINDHCPHNSLEILNDIADRDSRVVIIDLPKNIGQQRAVQVGLKRAGGKWMVVMDADLQDPPEAIPTLFDEIQKGYDVVYAGRRGAYESRGRLLTARIFRIAMNQVCGLPPDAGIYLIMSRQMRDRIQQLPGPPFLAGMTACAQLPLQSVPVERMSRPDGESAYSFWDRLKVAGCALFWSCFWRRYCFDNYTAPEHNR